MSDSSGLDPGPRATPVESGLATRTLRPTPEDSTREQLLTLTHDALERLYDYVFLQSHPLAERLGDVASEWNRGAALHRVLVETIERLKPPAGTPTHSPLWRRYRHVFMRYVEAATLVQIADDLGVSERQARRDHRDALEAIVDLLQQRLNPKPNPPRGASRSVPGAGPAGASLPEGAAAPTTVLLSSVVDGALATLERLVQARSLTFEVCDAGADVAISALDRTTLRQIVLGMALNAIDLAVEGSRIGVDVQTVGAEVHLDVRVMATKATDPEVTAAVEGRLALGKRLASKHGATLVREASADGVRFGLSLPVLRTPTVLLVEDNAGMRRLMRRYLGGHAYAVLEARSASEALALATSQRPDVITLDIMLPETDGWELLQTLRAQPATRHIPVIVCSVLRERELAYSLGATEFLAKPLTRDALLQALAATLPAPSPELTA